MISSRAVLLTIAILFGWIWLYVSLYTYAPVYRKAFMKFLGRDSGPRQIDSPTDLDDRDLPTIDILMAAYDEAETVGHAIRSIREADYPSSKLQVNVLVEPGDRSTRNALSKLRQDLSFREIPIPESYPGTPNKPRALNYGFDRTDGDIIGVLDAEDIVAPHLFKQVVNALVDHDFDYVQGRLDMVNEDDGLLNKLFRGEYGFWYGLVIPGFFRAGYPVPLGGTTNFAWRDVLREAAGERLDRFGPVWSSAEQDAIADRPVGDVLPWDPRNVTEDFELGLLLWEMEKNMAMVTAVTREESPIGVNAWVRQRTRWQKGKLFTFIQRLYYPPEGIRKKFHVYTQSAVPHLGPLNIVGVLVLGLYMNFIGFRTAIFVALILFVAMALAIQQITIHAIAYWRVTDTRGGKRILGTVLSFIGIPLYWLLLWGSDVRAMVQLAHGSLGWEKTAHPGRHISSDEPTDRFQFVIFETIGGWTWRLEDGHTAVAQSGRTYPSLSKVREATQRSVNILQNAVGNGPVFVVTERERSSDWTLYSPETALAKSSAQPLNRARTLEQILAVKNASTRSFGHIASEDNSEESLVLDETRRVDLH